MAEAQMGKVLAISLACGLACKLLLIGVAALALGMDAARPLLFPGTGILLGAVAYPFVRRRFRSP